MKFLLLIVVFVTLSLAGCDDLIEQSMHNKGVEPGEWNRTEWSKSMWED